MAAKGKKIKIGFDLDGVIIGKPPFVPKKLIEWLYRGRINKKLVYRYPGKIEKRIRWLSHYPLFRPAIKKNLEVLKRLSENENVKLYAISGRYSFLKGRTISWLRKNSIEDAFKKVYLNEDDEQPHRFKKKVLVELQLDYFVEDDPLIAIYLKRELKSIKVVSEKKLGMELAKYLNTKVLIGISYYRPNISGLTIYAQNLAEELAKRGYKVKVITSKHQKELASWEKMNGVRVERVWTPFILGRGPIMPTYPFAAYKAVRDTDIVNCHIPSFEAVFLCFWAKFLGKRVILTHHCDLSNWPGFINQITEKITYLSLLVSGFSADKIVVYTKDYADHSDYLQRFKNKLFFCLPPVKVEKPDNKFKLRYKRIKYKIGFAGRIAKEKGIEFLIKTIPYLKKESGESFKIFLAGPYKEVVGGGNLGELDDLIKKNKKYLVLLGSLGVKDMANFYTMCDVLVLPSTEKIESFGFVQVEAMLLGCPVVASDLPGVRMPIKLSGMGKTIQTKNSEALAKTVSTVLKNKKDYVKQRAEIERIFNYRKAIDAYEELFKNLS